MIELVKKIISYTFDELKASPDVLLLLNVYSKLFLHGSPTGLCERCHRQYYQEILKDGLERAKIYEDMEKRTLIPNWIGIKYIRGAFYDSAMISDEQAILALQSGYLKEANFKKLPENYKQLTEVVTDLPIIKKELNEVAPIRNRKAGRNKAK